MVFLGLDVLEYSLQLVVVCAPDGLCTEQGNEHLLDPSERMKLPISFVRNPCSRLPNRLYEPTKKNNGKSLGCRCLLGKPVSAHC